MNAVEIEEAVSELASVPFDSNEFPFAFLQAFGNKETTVRRLRARSGNASDVPSGVLQRNNIHLAICAEGVVGETLRLLRESPKTAANKAKFVLATDGITIEAEELVTGEVIACDFARLGDHFGFFLPLAGISTVRQIKSNPIDVKATGRLNRLYVELLKENPEWGTPERRHDLNQFMARLIFCYFAENTGIFAGQRIFTETVRAMSNTNASDTHEVISTLFRAMDVRAEERVSEGIRSWANRFPYVNGALFSGSTDCPRFSRIARSYLLRAGELSWRDINPDIFGSMIQAVADDEERGALGLHYTSVPNILKVLNPLFLDDLREKLNEASDNPRKLLNLRNRMARIRVFDPACGSGNFLVIAYKQMREIEAEINRIRGEPERASEIPLTNFRGIELRDFPAEIARLALIIAEYQADVLYRGQKLALAEFLPLDQENWITCGNALRLDWLSICPPSGTSVNLFGDDLFRAPIDQAQINFTNDGGETYICGNPPYIGDKFQTSSQKADLKLLAGRNVKAIDYITGWFWKASSFIANGGRFAFVSTNSVCQGVQVELIWPRILKSGRSIFFAHKDFLWGNSAARNAQVTCVIVGVSADDQRVKHIYDGQERKEAQNINAYLVAGKNIIVQRMSEPLSNTSTMFGGNIPRDQGNLLLEAEEATNLLRAHPEAAPLIKPILGSSEFINGIRRYCLWIDDNQAELAYSIPDVRERLTRIRTYRMNGSDRGRAGLETPYKFERTIIGNSHTIIIPSVSSERRHYLPCGLLTPDVRVSNLALALYDAPLWNMAIIASRLHLIWIATICGKMKTDFRYSNTLGWNTFPVPPLTENSKVDLTRCAKEILLAREAHFPATIADLYNPDKMPDDLRRAHEANDETLERIYIGRRFRNDTERLEKLFDMYSEMVAPKVKTSPDKTRINRKSAA